MGTLVKSCCIDRLGDLPDSVLCHILSFLPTKQVVRTSILSTRWRYLYTSVTTLDFADDAYESSNGFMNFVDRVLFSHDTTCIERFHLHLCFMKQIDQDCSTYQRICGWISLALERCAQELDLELDLEFYDDIGDPSGIIPTILFTSKTLVKFVLRFGFEFMTIPTKVCFPSLKILHLINVDFVDNDSVRRLFAGCLVLEELLLFTQWKNISEINISIPSLKSLTMETDDPLFDPNLNIVIDAPSLVNFKLVDVYNVVRSCLLLNLHSLVKAHLEIVFDDYINRETVVANIFEGITNVQSLYIRPDLLWFSTLCNKSKPLPVFRNLVLLKIDGDGNMRWDELDLVGFLASSPNLGTLIFDTECFHISRDHTKPSCVLPDQLKVIDMKSFEAYHPDDLLLVEYFLKNASGLEKLKIQMDYNLPEIKQLEIAMKLLMFPRVSKVCQVEIKLSDNSSSSSSFSDL